MERVLALYPGKRVISFAVLEGSERLVDWGTTWAPGIEAAQATPEMQRVARRALPDLLVLVIPWGAVAGDRASRQLAHLDRALSETAESSGTLRSLRYINRDAIGHEFQETGAATWDIALALRRQFPELASWLPKREHWWDPIDERLGIALALAGGLTVIRTREWSDHDAA